MEQTLDDLQLDALTQVRSYLYTHFAVVQGPRRAFYEVVNGVIDWDGENLGAKTDPEDTDEAFADEQRERGVYCVFGFSVVEDKDHPLEEHPRLLKEQWLKFLDEVLRQIGGQSKAVVLRRGFEYKVDGQDVWDDSKPAYSKDAFEDMRQAASDAWGGIRAGLGDAFLQAQADAIEGYEYDPEVSLWRKRTGKQFVSRLTLRCHFRGIEKQERLYGRYRDGEGPVVINVTAPIDLLQAVNTEAPPLQVGGTGVLDALLPIGQGPCHGKEVSRLEEQCGSLIVSDQWHMGLAAVTDSDLREMREELAKPNPLLGRLEGIEACEVYPKPMVTQAMVDRFLSWKLPKDFHPDGGITFKREYNETSPFGLSIHEPIGTNLFTAEQARAMLEYVLGIYQKPEPKPAPVHPHPGQGKPLNKD